jgi:hypothetical protein
MEFVKNQITLIIYFLILNVALISSCASTQQTTTKTEVENTNSVVQIEKIEPNWVYINKYIEWESPPKAIEQTFQGSLNSNIVVFYPSGKFAFVGCTLYRDNKTKNMSISVGDDFSVRKGNWKRNENGSLIVTSHLTHSAAENNSEQIENWKIKEQSSQRLAKLLEIDGEIYIPLRSYLKNKL